MQNTVWIFIVGIYFFFCILRLCSALSLLNCKSSVLLIFIFNVKSSSDNPQGYIVNFMENEKREFHLSQVSFLRLLRPK